MQNSIVRKNEDFCKYRAPAFQKRAREIMGYNMFGIEEAIRHYEVIPTKQQFAALTNIPFTEATLDQCKETHILVAVFPLSIIEIRRKVKFDLFNNQDWYDEQAFAKDCGDVSWQLIRKTPVPNSLSKTWVEQQTLLSRNEETPTARIMVYTIISHYLATSERLFELSYIRCSDLDSGGNRIYVGYFDSDGLNISKDWFDYRYDYIGVSAVRKSD